ncbi:Adenine-specific methyltransferase [Planctomycetales bacterium 10988]|nr:Adenine-specific methyltransferase [Planctomycetales bacterium 10988]
MTKTRMWNQIHAGDCIEQMKRLPDEDVHLVFADPPFNIGYNYDVYEDRQEDAKYLDWSRDWMKEIHRVLTPDGTFWLAIGDEYAAELKILAQKELHFSCRSWVIWYYTFGVNCQKNFSRSHTHLLYFTKDPQHFTFNEDDPELRVPSARQLIYNDRRANPKGRLPDNTWILRPQELAEGFEANEDTWYFPRVAGTFKERAGFHGCQMPEQLLGRILLACSQEGEKVLDPFSGSGTTLAVAKKLKRLYLGFELSETYTEHIKQRLTTIQPGDPLLGTKEPLKSTPKKKPTKGKRS